MARRGTGWKKLLFTRPPRTLVGRESGGLNGDWPWAEVTGQHVGHLGGGPMGAGEPDVDRHGLRFSTLHFSQLRAGCEDGRRRRHEWDGG